MKKIIVYTTPTCPYSRLVKDFLKKKSVEFEEVDVTVGNGRMPEMHKISGQMGVPVIDIDGQVIVGWNKSGLEEALHKTL